MYPFPLDSADSCHATAKNDVDLQCDFNHSKLKADKGHAKTAMAFMLNIRVINFPRKSPPQTIFPEQPLSTNRYLRSTAERRGRRPGHDSPVRMSVQVIAISDVLGAFILRAC